MKIREGTQRIDNGTKKAIIEFVFEIISFMFFKVLCLNSTL